MIEPLRAYVRGGGMPIGTNAGAMLMTPDVAPDALSRNARPIVAFGDGKGITVRDRQITAVGRSLWIEAGKFGPSRKETQVRVLEPLCGLLSFRRTPPGPITRPIHTAVLATGSQ
jgi:hypothetical protein